MQPVRLYRNYMAGATGRQRMREAVRDLAVLGLSLHRSLGRNKGWIRFPFYHHVFDDERQGFARQIDLMRRHGEFITLDEAVNLLESGQPVDGGYFCLTFDDGFKNNATNALPILAERGVPAAVFLATGYIGGDPEKDRERLLRFYPEKQLLMEFLDWDDCRRMAENGFTIGSHTAGHAHLIELDEAGAAAEFAESKATIERELGRPCHHFCCPWGQPGTDFRPERDPALAQAAGYRSFLTTARGGMRPGDSPFLIRRDHLLANWGDHQIRYFLGR